MIVNNRFATENEEIGHVVAHTHCIGYVRLQDGVSFILRPANKSFDQFSNLYKNQRQVKY
jgi:hypothetical protein